MQNKILVIGADASSLRFILADSNNSIERIFTEDAKHRNELTFLDNFLKENNVAYKQIERIVVLTHKHNKTSVRVAKVIAQTIAWHENISLLEFPVDNLLSIEKTDLVLSILDA